MFLLYTFAPEQIGNMCQNVACDVGSWELWETVSSSSSSSYSHDGAEAKLEVIYT